MTIERFLKITVIMKKKEISKRWSINKTNLHENIIFFCFLKLLTELEFRWIWQNIANLQIVIACAGGTRKRGKNPTVALQLSSLSLLSYWVWKDAWTCPAQDIFCPRNTFCNWSIFSLWNWYCQKKDLKSVNLQYNTLGCLDNGTNKSSTKRLVFQVLFIFHDFFQKICKNTFNLFSYFFKKIQK